MIKPPGGQQWRTCQVGAKKHNSGVSAQDASTSPVLLLPADGLIKPTFSFRQIWTRQLSKRIGSKSHENWLRRVIEPEAQEIKIIELALIDRHGRLLEAVGDTTLTVKERRAAASELLLITRLLSQDMTLH
jgi:hypothetical protein